MMMKISQLYYLLFLSIVAVSAQAQINGNKQIRTRTYDLSSFSKIVIQTPASVIIEADAMISTVSITTDENIFVHLPVNQSGTQINIEPKTWIEPSELKIMIKTPSLEALRTGGYGDYQINGLSAATFVLDNPVGTVTINGQVEEFIFSMKTGKIDARELNAQIVRAKIESFGTAQVNAFSLLEANIEENGTVIYEQKPDQLRLVIPDDGQVLSAAEYQEVLSEREAIQKIPFKLRNNSPERIHAYVQGPENHRFSYGFSLNPRQKRAEEWPLGTEVYQVNKIGKRRLLVTIDGEDAGEVVDLF